MFLLCRPAAIDDAIGAGDGAGVLGTQIKRRLANVFGIAPTAHRNGRQELLVQLGFSMSGMFISVAPKRLIKGHAFPKVMLKGRLSRKADQRADFSKGPGTTPSPSPSSFSC